MTLQDSLEKLLLSFKAYYNVKTNEGITSPFAAEAEFHSHDEQYFLVRSARLSEAESHEYVYFASVPVLDAAKLQMLDQAAWENGQSRIRPHANHRNSDVTLIILSEQITKEAFDRIPRLRHYQSYRFGLQGWSHYRLIALELPSGRMAYNRQGQSLEKLVRNISKQKNECKGEKVK